MGKGIEAARLDAPEHAAVIDELKDQLIIVLMKRLGGSASIPVAEVDDTGGDTLSFNIIDRVFHFKIGKKQ